MACGKISCARFINTFYKYNIWVYSEQNIGTGLLLGGANNSKTKSTKSIDTPSNKSLTNVTMRHLNKDKMCAFRDQSWYDLLYKMQHFHSSQNSNILKHVRSGITCLQLMKPSAHSGDGHTFKYTWQKACKYGTKIFKLGCQNWIRHIFITWGH